MNDVVDDTNVNEVEDDTNVNDVVDDTTVNDSLYEGPVTRARGSVPEHDWVMS